MGQLLYLHTRGPSDRLWHNSERDKEREETRETESERDRVEKWALFKKKQRREEERKGDDLKAWRREVRVALRGQRALLELSSAAPTVSLAPSHLCAFPPSLSPHVVLSGVSLVLRHIAASGGPERVESAPSHCSFSRVPASLQPLTFSCAEVDVIVQ